MQDIRHDFNSFCFFRRITHCFHCPQRVLQLQSSSHLPSQRGHFLERCGEKVPQFFQVEIISRPRGEQTRVYGFIAFLENKAVAISVFLALDMFFQRVEEGEWTDVRTAPELRLWLLLGSGETSSFLAL